MHYSQKFQNQFDWQDNKIQGIIDLLTSIAKYPVKIEIASEELDNHFSTDLVATEIATKKEYHIAVRIRDETCEHRDLTLRSKLDSGHKTELEKVKEGCTDFYFYAWLTKTGMDWMFINMHKVRKSGILDKNWPDIDNKDGSFFIAIPKKQIEDAIILCEGC